MNEEQFMGFVRKDTLRAVKLSRGESMSKFTLAFIVDNKYFCLKSYVTLVWSSTMLVASAALHVGTYALWKGWDDCTARYRRTKKQKGHVSIFHSPLD